MATFKCERCGRERDLRVTGQRFCSDKCRVDAWMERHPRKKPVAKRRDRSVRNGRERQERREKHAFPAVVAALYGLRAFMWHEGYADQTPAMADADAALKGWERLKEMKSE